MCNLFDFINVYDITLNAISHMICGLVQFSSVLLISSNITFTVI